MFIPNWIIIVIIILAVARIFVAYKTRHRLVDLIKKHKKDVESFDTVIKVKNFRLHAYLNSEGNLVLEEAKE